MKKFGLIVIIGLLAAGMVVAQGWSSQALTVSGTLQLQNGAIAVVNGSAVYYVPTLERFIGFIDGLKEGAQVSVEGWSAPNSSYLQAVKLTIGGKSYDLAAGGPQGMAYNGCGPGAYGRMGRGGYGHGGYGWCH
jgi:hypothetical protein